MCFNRNSNWKGAGVRGTKAKRLRKAGLKPGPAIRPEPTERHLKRINEKIKAAKAPYSETKNIPFSFGGFSTRVRENIIKRREESLNNDNV